MSVKIGQKLAPYNPTNIECIQLALDLLCLKDGDIVYDLGCGDGRFLIQALLSVPAITIHGVEYDSELCERAAAEINSHSFSAERWSIRHENVLDTNFMDATALFIYLVPEGIRAIKESLFRILTNGGRIVTYVFSIPGINPSQVLVYKGSTKLYLYNSDSLASLEA